MQDKNVLQFVIKITILKKKTFPKNLTSIIALRLSKNTDKKQEN